MARRRRMTAARRNALRKAQLASARKRRGRSKDTLGHWIAKGARKVVSVATMGTSSALVELFEKPSSNKQRRKRKR